MTFSRRAFTTALAAASLGLSPWHASAQSVAEINKPDALGDMVLGSKDAPVTIIEYASMTCPHCAHFTKTVFPRIKSDYVDTGKVRFIFREFPLEPIALAASALARCVAKDDAAKYFSIIETLFDEQDKLTADALGTINRIGKQEGFSEQMIKECIEGNPSIQNGIMDGRDRANSVLKVDSTPSFFINGKLVKGAASFEEFEKEIKPLLKS